MSLTAKMAVAALLLGSVSPAWAGAGNGIRFGGSEGRLHPFLELEGRYDSNVYVSQTNQSSGDLVLHVRPGLKLEVPGEMTAVEVSAKLDFAQYLGLDTKDTRDLSKVYAEATLGVTVNPKGTLGLELDDLFRRSDRPQALSLGTGVISNYNALTVRVPWRPGGGALTLGVNGAWALETYERFFAGSICGTGALCDTEILKKLGYNELSGGADLRWKFLPRTSAILEGEYFKRIPNSDLAQPNDPAGYRLQAGVTGLVTPHLSATLEAGYGSTLGVTPSLGTWLATADLEWLPTETGSVALRYAHDLATDPTTLYELNRVSLEAKQLVAGRYTLRGRASLSRLGFVSGRGNSTVVNLSPGVEAEVTRWLRTELAYAYTDRASSDAAIAFLAAPDYTKHELWLKAVFTY